MSTTNHWRSFFEGQFLKGPDVPTREEGGRTYTIRHVALESVEDAEKRGEHRNKMVIRLIDEKPWIPSKVGAHCIAAMFGDDVRDWANRRVTLIYDPAVMFGRDKVGGVRVLGSPDLKSTIRTEVKMPRKRPKTVELVRTEAGGGGAGPRPDLAETLTELLFDAGEVSAYLEANGRSAIENLKPGERQKLADWLRGPGEVQVRAYIDAQVEAGTPPTKTKLELLLESIEEGRKVIGEEAWERALATEGLKRWRRVTDEARLRKLYRAVEAEAEAMLGEE